MIGLSLNIENGVHHMFQHFGPCDKPLFGHMADEKDGNGEVLGKVKQSARCLSDLADGSGCGRKLRRINHLDRIDHHGGGSERLDILKDFLKRGFGNQKEVFG